MSVKTYIISLSLTGAVAGLGCWMFLGSPQTEATPGHPPAKNVTAKASRPLALAPTGKSRAPGNKSAASAGRESGTPLANAAARNALPPPVVEPATPEARAARVEQEANHELRRLVPLLNLSDTQQDQVFQSLARNSRYWTPEMQVAAPGASSAGKRGQIADAAPGGVFIPGTETPDKSTAPSLTPAPTTVATPAPDASDNAAINDPMSEIMSLLTPEQQSALLESEMDRTAWWAEILPEILPADEVPNIDGSTPGGTQAYEGSETLE